MYYYTKPLHEMEIKTSTDREVSDIVSVYPLWLKIHIK